MEERITTSNTKIKIQIQILHASKESGGTTVRKYFRINSKNN